MKTPSMTGGRNRTGISRAPELADAMLAATEEFPPSAEGDASGLIEVRTEYARRGEPIGTMPAPGGLKQLAKSALGALTGGAPFLLLDKLGERLAFERTGTRLYDALVGKVASSDRLKGGPSREDVAHIRGEELEHARMLEAAIRRLGADPTVVTPSADVQAVAGRGIGDVLADPRTTVVQSLEAILVAELADNDSWAALLELSRSAGDEEAVRDFTRALEQEQEHLEKVRTWVATAQGRSVDGIRLRSAGEREAMRAALGTDGGGAARRRSEARETAAEARTARAAARRAKAGRRGGRKRATARASSSRARKKTSRRRAGS